MLRPSGTSVAALSTTFILWESLPFHEYISAQEFMIKLCEMEISKVNRQQIESVMSLIKNAIREMERNGIHQWDEIYPAKKTILSDIDAGNLFSVIENHYIIGIVTLNEEQSPEYQAINWSDNIHPLIIHRLCVDPNFQGHGIAKYLMRYSEEYGRENHYISIRLDAFSENNRAVGLYESLNYVRKGTVIFRKGNFYCYEKLLKTIISV